MLQPSGEGDPLLCDLVAQLQPDGQPLDGQPSQRELDGNEGVDGASWESEVQTLIRINSSPHEGNTAY